MNMLLHELKAYRNTTLLWTGAMIGLVLAMMSIYPSIARDANAFREVLESMPESVVMAAGIGLDSIASLLGYYSYIFLYVTLAGAIQAMHLGVSILSKESREKTADFLLSKPVKRGEVFVSKTAAATALLAGTTIIFSVAAGAIVSAVKLEGFDYSAFALVSLSLLFIQLVFLAIGIAAAVLLPRLKTVLPTTLGTVFGFFVLSFIGASTGDGKLRYVMPFHYYDRAYIISNGHYEAEFVAVSALVMAVCVTFGAIRYLKRDVHAV